MSRAVLSLGSNLGSRAETLAAAVRSFGGAVRAVSSVYETPPWGPVEQDDYYNLVLIVDDDRVDAAGWLERSRAAERAAGRERSVRWGPRTLDVDVIAVTDAGSPLHSDDPELLLPHPRAAERLFVLLPWLEIEPGAVLPGVGSVGDLVAAFDATELMRVRRLDTVRLDTVRLDSASGLPGPAADGGHQ